MIRDVEAGSRQAHQGTAIARLAHELTLRVGDRASQFEIVCDRRANLRSLVAIMNSCLKSIKEYPSQFVEVGSSEHLVDRAIAHAAQSRMPLRTSKKAEELAAKHVGAELTDAAVLAYALMHRNLTPSALHAAVLVIGFEYFETKKEIARLEGLGRAPRKLRDLALFYRELLAGVAKKSRFIQDSVLAKTFDELCSIGCKTGDRKIHAALTIAPAAPPGVRALAEAHAALMCMLPSAQFKEQPAAPTVRPRGGKRAK